MYGALIASSTVATTRPHAESVRTAEMESTASSSERVARWLTKTGTNVAVRIPPNTRSWMMFGVLLARLNASDRFEYPRA